MVSSTPTRILAGVEVPDTPLITKAIDFAKASLDPTSYNHVIRSWLCGQFIASHIPSLENRDVEVQALAAVLHDLGWALSVPALISKDKRFEVDSANATREFIQREGNPEEWGKHRVQLVWDAVALHATVSIAAHKEVEVQAVLYGIGGDFTGWENIFGGVLTKEVWDGIVKEYPRQGLREGTKAIMCELCRIKPETTYDNMVGDFGVKFVEGYSRDGKTGLDVIMATVE